MRNLYDWLPEQTRWPFYLPLAAAFQLYFSLWLSISCHSPLSEHLERVFDNKYQNSHFKNFFFQLLTWKSSGNSIDTTEKTALKLVACLASVSNRVMARKLEATPPLNKRYLSFHIRAFVFDVSVTTFPRQSSKLCKVIFKAVLRI